MSKRSRRVKRQNRKKCPKKKKPKVYKLRDFIEFFWIKGMKRLLSFNPYMSAFQIGVGIELLGTILDTARPMDQSGYSTIHFCDALQNINALQMYAPYVGPNSSVNRNQSRVSTIASKLRQLRTSGAISSADETRINNILASANLNACAAPTLDLYAAMRCGLLHSGIPSNDLYLARNMPCEVMQLTNGKWVLDVKLLYNHFVDACNEVLAWPDLIVQNRLDEEVFQVTSLNAAAQANPNTNAAAQANQNANGQTSVPTLAQNIPNQYTTNTPIQNSSYANSVVLSGGVP